METPRSPFNTTFDGNLYGITAEPNYYANNQSTKGKSYLEQLMTGGTVYISIISCLEVPMICLAIYAVYTLDSKQAAPVFVKNLLISDLIQIVCMLLLNFAINFYWNYILLITTGMAFSWAAFTGLYFMTCIAVERYVLIAHPVWHRSHRSVKCFVCTSLIGWLIPFIVFPVSFFRADLVYIIPFIPYAVIVLCFVGSCRSLSHSISLTPLKQQLVLGPLFFVVMSYTFLILPFPISCFLYYNVDSFPSEPFIFTIYIYLLNPLVDCLLYVFMRSDAENIIRMPHCCSRLKRVQTETGQTTSTDVQNDHM